MTEIDRGRRIGTIPLAGGEATIYTKGIECKSEVAFKSESGTWEAFEGFIPIRNWFSFYEVAMHLLFEEYKNPLALSKYFSIDESVSDVLSEAYNPEVRENILNKLNDLLGEQAEALLRSYDRFRRFKEAENSISVELYNPVSSERYKAYLLFTDMENKKRSRLGLNDINLNAFVKFLQKNLFGILPVADGNGKSIYISRERISGKDTYRIGNSEGLSFNLSVVDRINLSYCLGHYLGNYEVRPISTDKFRLVNSEKTGKPLIGVGSVLVPINRDLYKIFGLVSDCRY